MENKTQVTVKKMGEKALETLECNMCNEKKLVHNSCITAKFPVDANCNQCNGNLVPVLEFICTNCGNVISINADFLAQKVFESE